MAGVVFDYYDEDDFEDDEEKMEFGGTADEEIGREEKGENAKETAYAAYLRITRGCSVLDSGATKGCISSQAMGIIQQDRYDYGEGGLPDLEDSEVRFKFGGVGKGDSRL